MPFSLRSSLSPGVILAGALASLGAASLPAFADPATAPTAAPAVTPAAASESAAVDEGFGEVVSISATFFRTRIVDPSGRPLRGLEPKDLEVSVAGKEIPVLALDWYEEPLSLAAEADDPEALAPAPRLRVSHRGQVFVFFVDIDPGSGLKADLESRRQYLVAVGRLVESLPAGAYASVFSRDTHLKLRQDFTTDRKLVSAAIHEAVRSGDGTAAAKAEGPSFLRPHFDESRARLAVSADRALEAMALALDPLPGEKVLVYLRLGQGRFENARQGTMAPEMLAAVRALQAARVSVFVFDHVGWIKPSSLEFDRTTPPMLILQTVVGSTGGKYVEARPDPHPSARRLSETIRGYYLVTLDPNELPKEQTQVLSVKLRKKKGEVLLTPVWTTVEREEVDVP